MQILRCRVQARPQKTGRRMYFILSITAAVLFISGTTVASHAQQSMDVVGFKIGMTAAAAKPLFDKMQKSPDRPIVQRTRPPMNSAEYIVALSAADGGGDRTYDLLQMFFSAPPSGNEAILIQRYSNFKIGEQPGFDQTKAAILAKYGNPSKQDGGYLYYFFSDGKLISEGHPAFQNCYGSAVQISMSGLIRAERPSDWYNTLARILQGGQGKCGGVGRIWLASGARMMGSRRETARDLVGSLNIAVVDLDRFVANAARDRETVKAAEDQARKNQPPAKGAPKL